jgi:hypothetical protein
VPFGTPHAVRHSAPQRQRHALFGWHNYKKIAISPRFPVSKNPVIILPAKNIVPREQFQAVFQFGNGI